MTHRYGVQIIACEQTPLPIPFYLAACCKLEGRSYIEFADDPCGAMVFANPPNVIDMMQREPALRRYGIQVVAISGNFAVNEPAE